MIERKGDLYKREKEKTILAYGVGSIFILGLHYFMEIREYPYDAQTYWVEGPAYYGLEKFDLLNYKNPLRGYLFPLFTYVVQKLEFEGLGSKRAIFCIVTSLLYSFLFMVLIPKMVELLFKITVPVKSRVLYLIVCMIMLRGLILYPLTDLPGLLFVYIAICFYAALMQDRVKTKWAQIICAVCMGISLGGAYYVRPVYLIVWIVLGGMILINVFHAGKGVMLFSIAGMLIISMPQICINKRNFDTYSPMIQTQLEYGESLYLSQLKWGISMQKYETSIDSSAVNIQPKMIFEDSIGAALLEGQEEIDSYFSYIVFCVRHFADMACIYLKHIFNGLDITYPNVYIQNVYCNRFLIQLLNYTLIFVGIEGLAFFIYKKCWNTLTIEIVSAYGLPILLVIPTAVETRFFVGVHVVLYLFAAMALTNREWWCKILHCKWKKAGVWLLFLGVCFTLNSQTFNYYGIPLWGGR